MKPLPFPPKIAGCYFIQSDEGGPIKIGYATDMRKRLAGMQGGSPVRLRIIGYVRGDKNTERELHQQFAHLRLHGEWFRDAMELKVAIGRESKFLDDLNCNADHQITATDAAYEMGIATRTVIGLIQAGKMPGRQVGRIWRINVDDWALYKQCQWKPMPKPQIIKRKAS